jgi:hypothetical protein
MAKISTRNITDENVDDVMTTAAYGGITYWADEPTAEDFAAAKPGEHTIRVDDEGWNAKVYHLSPAKIRQAIVEVAEGKHTNSTVAGYVQQAFRDWNAEDGIDCGEIDADAADCIVQVACFGKVVYG